MPLVQIVNRSTVMSDADLAAILPALQRQISNDLNIPWVVRPVKLELVPTTGEPDALAWQLLIVDNPTIPGALGYHDWTPSGLPVGYIFAALDLKDGLSVPVTISHELIEMLGDPWINRAVQAGPRFYAGELCDPVEADQDGYDISVDVHMNPISPVRVSNFVFPNWFVPGAPGPYDFLGLLSTPLSLRAGGYASFVDMRGSKGWQQVTSREGQRHKATQHLSRRDRRHRLYVA